MLLETTDAQVGLFPAGFSEKYRPRRIADFAGLEKPKKVLSKLVARPTASSWLFIGPPGLGKTTMALALAEEIPAELHHIPSRKCDLATVEETCYHCHFYPWSGKKCHLVLVDEADEMTSAAQNAFLSKLDATAMPPNTIFVFTANASDRLEKRFLSRCRVLEFSSYGIAAEASKLLESVWQSEGNSIESAPDFRRIIKDSCNNLRDALMQLELAAMAA